MAMTWKRILLTAAFLLVANAALSVVGVVSEYLLWPRPLANAGQLLYRAVFWLTLPGRLVLHMMYKPVNEEFPIGSLLISAFATPPLVFALFAFGLLFGFLGLLLAVPLTAIAGVVTRYAVKKYQESALYLGTTAPVEPHETESGASTPRPARSPRRRTKSAK